MKKYLFAAVVLLCSSIVAPASIPVPPERPYALAQAGDNFQFNPAIRVQAPGTVPQPAPTATVANGTPIVVTAPAAGGVTDWLTALNSAILALIAGLLGFKKPAGTSAAVPGGAVPATPTDVGTIVASIFHPNGTSIIANPAVRQAVDAALLQVVQSGIPGTAITAAAGLVPGVAPVASVLEPMLRRVVEQALAARMGGQLQGAGAAGVAVAPTVPVPAGILGDLTAVLQKLVPKPAVSL